MKNIKIFDTTLRDGEQSPGCSMNLAEKLQLAKQLEKLNVDIIEAGFAIASKGDFESIQSIANTLKNTTVASLSRALTKDIDCAWESIKSAKYPRIHTFIATSDIHMKYKLQMNEDSVVERAVNMVKYAKKYCSDIEFSAEDATRSKLPFLYRIFTEVIKAGATTINIPDTVGYTTPHEYYKFIRAIKENVPGIDKVDISVHCHNDLGMAVANSLIAIEAGATQIECTVNGIGERAGNAALEEIVMAMKTRNDLMKAYTNINTEEILKTSEHLSRITGVNVQPNKAIVGANAFAHEAGIHQHGVLAERTTYEIMTPESIGLTDNKLVLGKHSGKHAFIDKLQELGYSLEEKETSFLFDRFKTLCDKKKTVYDSDIEALIADELSASSSVYKLEKYVVNTGNDMTTTACIEISKDNERYESVAIGQGPINASFEAVKKVLGKDFEDFELFDYSIDSVSNGNDALGEVVLKLKKGDSIYKGKGLSVDIIESSIRAYLNAINRYMVVKSKI